MTTPITAKFSTTAAMTITLASLATSTVGVGRQSTMVDNTTNLAQMLRIYFKVTTGTSPTANKSIQFYLITADKASSPNIITDGAGASDAGLTIVSAPLVCVVQTTNTSDKVYQGSFLIRNPGTSWGIAVVHDTAVNLNSTGSNHALYYVEENTQI
jgi:hypothetical protein